jgi:hypothetical protein
MDYTKFLSKFAFIFLIFVVVSSGYLKGILSCQMQNFLENISFGKHLLGVIMIFVFIMLEGGWSFNQEENDMADNDWSSGNVVDSLAIGILIYIIFVISSKSRLVYNIIFYIIVFLLYMTNTQRSYYYVRKLINDDTNNKIIEIEKYVLSIAIFILIVGLIDYIIYQKNNYKSKFSWYTFLMGVTECSKLKK